MSNTSIKVAFVLFALLATPAASFARGEGGRGGGAAGMPRCAWHPNWHGESVGQPEQQVGDALGSPAAATAHKRPGGPADCPKR